MKLPNGFGTCYKLGGNRRRPWVVKKTINGKQKTLGYFATYVDGLSHLFAVNDTDVMQSEIPFSAIYERWRKDHFPSISVSSQKAYEICFRHLSPLHSRAFSSLKYRDLQEAIDQVKTGCRLCDTEKSQRTVGTALRLCHQIRHSDYRLCQPNFHRPTYPGVQEKALHRPGAESAMG